MSNTQNLKKILSIVASATYVSQHAIKSKSRKYEIVMARHLYAYFAITYTFRQLNEIGALINRSHSTIIHSRKVIINRLHVDKEFKRKFKLIEKKII